MEVVSDPWTVLKTKTKKKKRKGDREKGVKGRP
jgi:hypothetical protein